MSEPAPPPDAAGWPAGATLELLERPAFRRELSPTWISAAALLAGEPPLDPGRQLRFADLACRSGVHAAVVAACHPDAEVWAVDRDPANVERAMQLATDAGLDNLTVVEWTPSSPVEDRLPGALDVVVLEDVISTVDAARRAELAELVARRVRPGGLVAVSYRTLSGWAEIVPLRRLALLLAGAAERSSDERVDVVISVLRRLADGGATFVCDRPTVKAAVQAMLEGPPQRVEELLLTEHLEPLPLDRVTSWLRPAGAAFVGTLRLGQEPAADSPLGELLASTADRRLREALRDVATRPAHRVDLFRRGSSPLSATVRRARLDALELIGLDGVDPATVSRRAGDEHRVRELLGQGLAHPRSIGWATGAADRCRALNAAFACHAAPGRPPVRAMPEIGSAVIVDE